MDVFVNFNSAPIYKHTNIGNNAETIKTTAHQQQVLGNKKVYPSLRCALIGIKSMLWQFLHWRMSDAIGNSFVLVMIVYLQARWMHSQNQKG